MVDTPWGKLPVERVLNLIPAREDGSIPGPSRAPAALDGRPDAGTAEISDYAFVALQLIAGHERVSLSRAVELAAFAYCEGIGATALLDAQARTRAGGSHANFSGKSCHGSRASRAAPEASPPGAPAGRPTADGGRSPASPEAGGAQ